MQKPWYPQQNIADAPVALLKNLMSYIGFPVSKLTIEKETKEHKEFPMLSFGALVEILEKLGIKATSYNSKMEDLSEIPPSTILFIEETVGGIKSGEFVMFHELNNGTIEYLHARKGWIIEDLKEFEKKWAKAALSLMETINNGEKDFEAKEKEYIELKKSNPDLKNVSIHDDFLTDTECEHIISISKNEFKRSLIMGDEKNIEYHGRTSYTAELHVFPNDEIMNGIRKRASELIKVPESHFEYFQCVSYDKTQELENHFDTFDETKDWGRKAIAEGGQRKYTMLAYLNDDFEGGGTHFPNLDLLVQPKKRRVVIFNNLDEKEQVIKAAFHAGLPVTTGRKYAINMWVRTKPCR